MKRKKKTSNALKTTLSAIWTFIKGLYAAVEKIVIYLWQLLKAILIIAEKALKIVAIFIVAISASVLMFAAALYVFTSSFGLKDSPAFEDLRDRIAELQVLRMEHDIQELEEEILEEINEDNEDDS